MNSSRKLRRDGHWGLPTKWSKLSQPVVNNQDAKHPPSAQSFAGFRAPATAKLAPYEKLSPGKPDQDEQHKRQLQPDRAGAGRRVFKWKTYRIGWWPNCHSYLLTSTLTRRHVHTCTHVHTQIHVIIKWNHIYYTGLRWYLKQQEDHGPLKHVNGNQNY